MRILQLTNYPTNNPIHGGMIRAAQIAGALRSAGHEVQTVAVYLRQDDSPEFEHDIAIHKSSYDFDSIDSFLWDYAIGLAARSDRSVKGRLKAVMQGRRYDIIMVEQPWLFELAAEVASSSTRSIYSSHNIEWRLKDSKSRAFNAASRDVVQHIRKLEQAAVRASSMVVTCTQTDADDLRQLAGVTQQQCSFIVCGNGVEPFTCEPAAVTQWQEYFKRATGSHYAVYVSSAHPPNAVGFWDLMSPGLTFLRPTEQIVVVGGVSSILLGSPGVKEYRDVNHSRLHLVGQRPKVELQAMVRAAHVCLLPIASGEGSNLKTAEALESGCHIVGTTKAFRGFEDAATLAHVSIADTADDFRKAVRQALNRPRHLGGSPREIREKYYWSTQLRPLLAALDKISA